MTRSDATTASLARRNIPSSVQHDPRLPCPRVDRRRQPFLCPARADRHQFQMLRRRAFTSLRGPQNGCRQDPLFSLSTPIVVRNPGRAHSIFRHTSAARRARRCACSRRCSSRASLDLDLSVSEPSLQRCPARYLARREAGLRIQEGADAHRPGRSSGINVRDLSGVQMPATGNRPRSAAFARGCCCSTMRPSGSVSRRARQSLTHVRQLVTRARHRRVRATHLLD